MNEPGYAAITQRYAEWSDPHLHVRVGNFYTILGRGLIARSFELPGVVLDQTGFPSRYSPTRDVDGVLGEATLGPFDARLLLGTPQHGRVLAGGRSGAGIPALSGGSQSGAQGSIRLPRSARIGAAYMRLVEPPQPDGSTGLQSEFGTGFAEVDPIALCGLSELAGGSLALPSTSSTRARIRPGRTGGSSGAARATPPRCTPAATCWSGRSRCRPSGRTTGPSACWSTIRRRWCASIPTSCSTAAPTCWSPTARRGYQLEATYAAPGDRIGDGQSEPSGRGPGLAREIAPGALRGALRRAARRSPRP